jgi:hypothetical protein
MVPSSPIHYYQLIKTDTPFDRLVNSATLTGSLRAAWASSPYLFLKQGPQNWKKEKEKKKVRFNVNLTVKIKSIVSFCLFLTQISNFGGEGRNL